MNITMIVGSGHVQREQHLVGVSCINGVFATAVVRAISAFCQ